MDPTELRLRSSTAKLYPTPSVPRFFTPSPRPGLRLLLLDREKTKISAELESLPGLRSCLAGGGGGLRDKFVTYEDVNFMKKAPEAKEWMSKSKIPEWLFAPEQFLKFPNDLNGAVSCELLWEYAKYRLEYALLRVKLQILDRGFTGYLDKTLVTEFVHRNLRSVGVVDRLNDPNEEPYYLLYASRKFLFAVEARKTGRISIREFLKSPVYGEMIRWMDSGLGSSLELGGVAAQLWESKSWFSIANYYHWYDTFMALDRDEDTVLCKEELYEFRYEGSKLTETLVDRVLEEHAVWGAPIIGPDGILEDVPRTRGLDFWNFLDFVLAFENLNGGLDRKDLERGMLGYTLSGKNMEIALPSIQYFWRVLDFNKVGHLDVFTLITFLRDVPLSLQYIFNLDNPDDPQDWSVYTPECMKDEIFDIVSPKDPSKITFQDMINCRLPNLIITFLCDPLGFYRYDNRERSYQQSQQFTPEEDDAAANAQAAQVLFSMPLNGLHGAAVSEEDFITNESGIGETETFLPHDDEPVL